MRNISKHSGYGRIAISGLIASVMALSGCPEMPKTTTTTTNSGDSKAADANPADGTGSGGTGSGGTGSGGTGSGGTGSGGTGSGTLPDNVVTKRTVTFKYQPSVGEEPRNCNWRVLIQELLTDGTVTGEVTSGAAGLADDGSCEAPNLEFKVSDVNTWHMLTVTDNSSGSSSSRTVRALFQPIADGMEVVANSYTEGAVKNVVAAMARGLSHPKTLKVGQYESLRDTLEAREPCRAQGRKGADCSEVEVAESLRAHAELWAEHFTNTCFGAPSMKCAGSDFEDGVVRIANFVMGNSIDYTNKETRMAVGDCLPIFINGNTSPQNGFMLMNVYSNNAANAPLGAAVTLTGSSCIAHAKMETGTTTKRANFAAAQGILKNGPLMNGFDIRTSTIVHGNGYNHAEQQFRQRNGAVSTCFNVTNNGGTSRNAKLEVTVQVPVIGTTAATGTYLAGAMVFENGEKSAAITGSVPPLPASTRHVAFVDETNTTKAFVISLPGSSVGANGDAARITFASTPASATTNLAKVTWDSKLYANGETASFCMLMLDIDNDNYREMLGDALNTEAGRFGVDFAALSKTSVSNAERGVAIAKAGVHLHSPVHCEMKHADFTKGSLQGNKDSVDAARRVGGVTNFCTGWMGGAPLGKAEVHASGDDDSIMHTISDFVGNVCFPLAADAGDEFETRAHDVAGATRTSCVIGDDDSSLTDESPATL